ncbi:Ig-like domain-containing protein [Cohnella cellulosilytica]|uniref:Ig-like domain-containing protein n=1 Tax=Cohnella cellulosilytica TaxID=986710 RepID=A0ABW2FGY1_9BACL
MTSGTASGSGRTSPFKRRIFVVLAICFILIWSMSSALGNAHAATALAITNEPEDIEVFEGSPDQTFSVEAEGDGVLSYQWYRSDENGTVQLPGKEQSILTIPIPASAFESDYYVVVSDSATSVTSRYAHLKVNALEVAPEPTIAAQPVGNEDLEEGDPDLELSVSASVYSGTLSYQWYRNTTNSTSGGFLLEGKTTSTLTVSAGGAHDSYYYVVVTNSIPDMKTSSVKSGTAHVLVTDVTSPSVTISSAINRPTAQATFAIKILFSEPVTGFSAPDVSVDNGSLSNFQETGGILYTADITAVEEGPVTIGIAANAAEDNYGHGNIAAAPYVVTYDTTGPKVNISSSAADPTNQSSFVVTLAFDEPPLNFSADDIAVTNGTASQLQSADGLTYTAVIQPTVDGTVTVHMAAGVVNDAAGNANTAALTSFSTVYDATAPTVSITSSAADPTNQSPFEMTFTFSEAVTGFVLGDIAVTNGSASNLITSDNVTYKAEVAPNADGPVTVNVAAGAATDAAGNANIVAAAPYSIVFDNTPPVPTILSPGNQTRTTDKRPEIKGTAEAGSTVTITIDGDESHVQADSNGEWQFRPANNLPNGTHTITVDATDPAGNDSEVQAGLTLVIYTESTSGGTAENTPEVTKENEPDLYTDVLINGKAFKLGKLTASRQNDRSVATLTIDERGLETMLAGEGPHAVLTIPMNTDSDVLIGELNGQIIKTLEQMQAVVELKTKHATYRLPAQQFDIDTLVKQYGNSINLHDIAVQIEIAAPTIDTVQLLERAAKQGGFTVAAPPVSFIIRASHAGKIEEISKFNTYVERTITLPKGANSSGMTTGVAIEPDGTVRHVPTRIEVVDGNYTAHIHSLTNSIYAVVWHPLEFADMTNHWAKEDVNDMGSRMVIDGLENGLFSPDDSITRAEFAAILVRGLGLKLENDREAFSDVKSADWYSDAVHTAYAYNLIDGFEDGTFRPNDKLSREQAMAVIAKAMKMTNGPGAATMTAEAAEETLRSYTDAVDASVWARSGIASSVKSGVILGRSESALAPKANITRAEVAVMVKRLLKQAGLI